MAATRTARAVAFALAVGALPGAVAAEDRVGGAVMAYSDDDGVEVTTAVVRAEGEVGVARIDAAVGVDVISAASVDLVSAASPRGFEETRNSVDVGVDWAISRSASVGATGGLSLERDYVSRAAGARGALELPDGVTSLDMSVIHSQDEVGRAGDPRAWSDRASERLSIGATRILDPVSAVDVAGTVLLVQGYQESPYRWVPLRAGGAGAATWLAEEVPERRVRGSGEVRLRRRLATHTFGAAELHGLTDDWGVRGGAARLRLSQGIIDDRLTATAHGRGYAQTGASFWRESYGGFPEQPRWRTVDKELSPLWSLLGGLRLESDLRLRGVDRLVLDLGADVLDVHTPEVTRRPRLTALLVSGGVEARF